MELLSECEQPGLVQSLLLPEDLALRHLPALNLAHRRLDYTRPRPSLSPVQEVHTPSFPLTPSLFCCPLSTLLSHLISLCLSPSQCVVRVCCIRSFGHFLTNLQCNVLHFNPEAGIFTSISQSEQDNLVQQAKAQIRMVSGS